MNLLALLSAAAIATTPVPLIFDTDMGNDVDDVLALGLIHALQSRGECRLLAVTIAEDHPLAAAFANAVNTFYGRGDIPIGIVSGGVTPDLGRFLKLATERDGDSLRYPRDLDGTNDTPEAWRLLRRVLAAQPDGSVVIAQVGFSNNLTSVLYPVRPDRDYFGLSEPGRITMEEHGRIRFEPAPDGRHRYLTMSREQSLRVVEAFVAWCSQPPCRGPLDPEAPAHAAP